MSKLLSYPDVGETQVWNVILKIIRTDPWLNDPALLPRPPKIVTYTEGLPESKIAKPEPDIGDLPYARISLAAAAANFENNHQIRATIAMAFELFTEGQDESDILNFWGAIRRCVFPADPARREKVIGWLRGMPGMSTPTQNRSIGGINAIGRTAHGLRADVSLILSIAIEVGPNPTF